MRILSVFTILLPFFFSPVWAAQPLDPFERVSSLGTLPNPSEDSPSSLQSYGPQGVLVNYNLQGNASELLSRYPENTAILLEAQGNSLHPKELPSDLDASSAAASARPKTQGTNMLSISRGNGLLVKKGIVLHVVHAEEDATLLTNGGTIGKSGRRLKLSLLLSRGSHYVVLLEESDPLTVHGIADIEGAHLHLILPQSWDGTSKQHLTLLNADSLRGKFATITISPPQAVSLFYTDKSVELFGLKMKIQTYIVSSKDADAKNGLQHAQKRKKPSAAPRDYVVSSPKRNKPLAAVEAEPTTPPLSLRGLPTPPDE